MQWIKVIHHMGNLPAPNTHRYSFMAAHAQDVPIIAMMRGQEFFACRSVVFYVLKRDTPASRQGNNRNETVILLFTRAHIYTLTIRSWYMQQAPDRDRYFLACPS